MNVTLRSQRGASLVETVILMPIFLFIMLGLMQAAMVFHAKSSVNYAAFEAARSGSVNQASVASVTAAFQKALIPYYGGGRTMGELAATMAKVAADVTNTAVRVEILSPTQESFTDYNSPALQTKYGTSEPVIPNVGLDQLSCPRDAAGCQSNPASNASGQTLLDANLLKLRITYGIPAAKQMPIVGRFYVWALGLVPDEADAFKKALLADGRIPVVTSTVLRMQSDAIRNSAMVSSPGPGNGGDPGVGPGGGSSSPTCGPSDPGCATTPPTGSDPTTPGGSPDPTSPTSPTDPVSPTAPAPPTTPTTPTAPPGPTSPGGPTSPTCVDGVTLVESVAADVLFDFDKSVLNSDGKQALDQVIAQARGRDFESLALTGYTDPLGTDAYNAPLSLARANSVPI